MTDRVDVMLESECSDADLAAVAEVFEAADIPADVRGAYIRESAAELPWIIIMFVIAAWAGGTFLKAALQGAGDEAGRAGWRALMQLVKALYESRNASRAPGGSVSLRVFDPPVEIPLPRDLPDVAYRRLYEIQNPDAPLSGILRWSDEAQAWVDPFADRLSCDYPGCGEAATQARVRHPSETVAERRHFCDRHAAAANTGDRQAWA